MKYIIEILVAVACVYGIFIQLLRILWLYFPSFLKKSFIFKSKEPAKSEMLLYFLAAITLMAYFIFVSLKKIF